MRTRRTKKTAPPSRDEFLRMLNRMTELEIDELIADCETKGMHGWAQFFRLQALGPRTNTWEEQHIDPHGIWLPTLDDARRFVNRIWADLGYTDPPVVTALTAEDLEEQPHRVAYANEKEIRLWGDHAKLNTVIVHEAAHVIAKRLQVCDLHGPNWFGIYLSLLELLPGRFDIAKLKASAVAAGIEIAPPRGHGGIADG